MLTSMNIAVQLSKVARLKGTLEEASVIGRPSPPTSS